LIGANTKVEGEAVGGQGANTGDEIGSQAKVGVAFTLEVAPHSAHLGLQGEPGDYEAEIEIEFSDGQIQTVYDVLKFKVRQEF
jgi:hypothetical protein